MKTQIAKLKYLKIAPRKARLVASVLRGLSVNEAEAQLLMNSQRANPALLKLLRSAVSNAKNTKEMNPEKLFIKEIRVDQGPILKRHMPRAMGRANLIQKKSSHITLVLAESEKLKAPRFKIVKTEKISKREAAKKVKNEVKTEKPKTFEPEKEKVKKTEKQPGFMKKIFRRKSI